MYVRIICTVRNQSLVRGVVIVSHSLHITTAIPDLDMHTHTVAMCTSCTLHEWAHCTAIVKWYTNIGKIKRVVQSLRKDYKCLSPWWGASH